MNATVRHRRRYRRERSGHPGPSRLSPARANIQSERNALLTKLAGARGSSSRKKWKARLASFERGHAQ